jgi:uncharacterized membrane protein
MKCAAHPDTETDLRCGKCGLSVCPKCMVRTPVGIRCRQCANLKRLPTYKVSARQYIFAIAVGLGTAVAAGFIWALIIKASPFILFTLLISAAIGYAVGELISLVTNRKRGIGLQAIGCISVVVCFVVFYLVVQYLFLSLFSLYMVIGLAIAIAVVIARLR